MAVQVDELELLAKNSVIATVNQMLAHPEARKLLLKARKTVAPNAPIPEIDVAEPVQAIASEVRKLLDEDKAERAKEREDENLRRLTDQAQRRIDDQKASLRAAGWREEGITEVEKFALERGVPDLEIAASHWEKLHPPADVGRPNSTGSFNWFDGQEAAEQDQAFMKAMMESRGEDENALNREIAATLQDARSQQPARR